MYFIRDPRSEGRGTCLTDNFVAVLVKVMHAQKEGCASKLSVYIIYLARFIGYNPIKYPITLYGEWRAITGDLDELLEY